MNKSVTFSFKGLKGEYFNGPAGSLYSSESIKKHKKQVEEERKSVADRHNESMQGGTDHRLWTLEPCGKLGK